MPERKQARLLALMLASLLVGAGLSRGQGATQQTQHLDASAQEHIRQLIASLPPDSGWRNLLEHHEAGDGIRQPWMDHMGRDGVKLAIFNYEFVWIREGRLAQTPALGGSAISRRDCSLNAGCAKSNPSPGPRRLVKTPSRSTLSPGERAKTRFPFLLQEIDTGQCCVHLN
jgi:hypothetical protein